MLLKYFILKVLCLSVCLATSSEESARDFMERILRATDRDQVLNSVLGRLERNRHPSRQIPAEENDCERADEILPEYTESIQESQESQERELAVRQITAQSSKKHYPICHLERKIKKLNTNEYEYRPAYYEEVRCNLSSQDLGATNEICSSLGFACVQWNKTIHLTRRLYSSDCWETRTLVIPAGCECMWPVHRLGDIKLHV